MAYKDIRLTTKFFRVAFALQVLLGGVVLSIYFAIRMHNPNEPGYPSRYSVLEWLTLAFVAVSVVSLFLLAREVWIAYRTKRIDKWLWILPLLGTLLLLGIIIVPHIFPPVFRGV